MADALSDISRAAAGETEGLDRAMVYEGIQDLMERLFGIPGSAAYSIPGEFWETPFGAMVMLAWVWAQGDELLTMSQAAQLSGRSVKALSELARKGKIRSYPDLSEPNPRKRTRLLKSDVEKLTTSGGQ